MKEGDVYRWEWKHFTVSYELAYWCLDGQAVFKQGKLVDTYWDGLRLDIIGSSSKVVNCDDVYLEFVCNLYDVDLIPKWEKEDYEKVYNLSTQKRCYEYYAIDKCAQPSKAKQIEKFERKIEEEYSTIRCAENSIRWMQEEISKLNN